MRTELVVKLKKTDDAYGAAHQIERLHDVHLRSNSMLGRMTGIFRISVPGEMSISKVDDLRSDKRIAIVEENRTMGLLPNEQISVVDAEPEKRPKAPNDPLYPKQWHLDMIDMPKAWNRSTGKGAVVAVLDTGVAFKSLAGNKEYLRDLDSKRCMKPYNAINGSKNPYDGHGHGSHCSGSVGQDTNNGYGCAGVAPDCRIMPVKVLSDSGSGSIDGIADGIYYAVKQGAHVISMSLGGPFYSEVLYQACKDAHKAGVLVVVAAGNEACDEPGSPAGFDCCLTVSAVGPDSNLAGYSSFGDFVNIAAPGGDIRKFGEEGGVLQETVYHGEQQFLWFQGSSMATPHVSGVAALLIQRGVKGSDALWQKIVEGAVDKGDPYKYGAGLLNAWNSLT